MQEIHLNFKDTHWFKMKGQKKILYTKGNQKRAGLTILRSVKIDCKSKTIIRDKEGNI